MTTNDSVGPESTAARVALWRAMHLQVDAPPSVFEDAVGLKLLAPPEGWQSRGDMHPQGTRLFRASIVARARFIEDLVEAQAARGVRQYVMLGAGIDTFAQRKRELASTMTVFEVDRAGPQEWKRRRLDECGYGVPEWLRFVSVDFERGPSWWEQLLAAGFDEKKPAVVTSIGVSLYLSPDAIRAMLWQAAQLARGSTFAMTYLLPLDAIDDPEERVGREMSEKGARGSGTPFITFYTSDDLVRLARDCGFREARHVPASELSQRYFTGRTDGLRLGKSEEILLATT